MFEAYKIGIKIAVAENVTKTLFNMTGAFKGVQKEADVLLGKLQNLSKFKLMAGTLALGTAGLAAIAIGKSIKPGSEYLDQIAKMNMAGMKHVDIVKSINAAWAAARDTPTSTATENLAAIGHMRMVFGNVTDPVRFLPQIQKAQAVLRFFTGKDDDESYELSKSLEMRGATHNVPEFSKQMNYMVQSIIAGSGKITPSDFLMSFKYGKTAAQSWNDDFTYKILPTLIQEYKSKGGSGSGAGTALMSSRQEIVGGVIPQKSLATWHKLGLLDPHKEIFNKVGSLKGIEPGAISKSNEFSANPFQWTQDVLAPALIKAGYKTPQQQGEILPHLFPNRTAQFAMSQFLLQPWKFTRDQKLIGQAQNLDAAYKTYMGTPSAQWKSLMVEFNNLLTQLGKLVLPPLTLALKVMVGTLQDMNAAVDWGIGIFKKLFTGSPHTPMDNGIISRGSLVQESVKSAQQASSSGNGITMVMDGEKVGKIVSNHQANAATMHTNNMATFNPRISVPFTNMNFAGSP